MIVFSALECFWDSLDVTFFRGLLLGERLSGRVQWLCAAHATQTIHAQSARCYGYLALDKKNHVPHVHKLALVECLS